MSDDAVRWDAKYRNRTHADDLQPDPLLVKYQDLFQPSYQVVDLASGSGRHSLFLAGRGCFVIPLDCSLIALQRCYSHAHKAGRQVYPVVADLTEFRFPDESLDAMICFNYLNRELSDHIFHALKPGGIFLMRTFNQNFLVSNPRFNPDYVLKPGELAQLFINFDFIELDDACNNVSVTKSTLVATKQG